MYTCVNKKNIYTILSLLFIFSFFIFVSIGGAEEDVEIVIQKGHSLDINSVTFSPDNKYIISGSWDTTVKLWEKEIGKEIRTFSGHSESVNSVAFSPDNKNIISGSSDKTVKLWEKETGKEIRTFSGHFESVNSVAFSPDNKYIISGSGDKTVKLWDKETGKEIRSFSGHFESVNSVAFSPDNKYIISGSSDKTVKLWDKETGKEIRSFFNHFARVNSVAISPDNKYIISGSSDKTVKLWDKETGKEIRSFSGYSAWVFSVAISPDSKYIISGSWDTTVKLWEKKTGKEIRTFSRHSAWVFSVAISHNNKYFISGSFDKTVKLWDKETGREIRTFSGHSDGVTSVAFSPDNKYIISGSRDKTVKLWDKETGREIRTFSGHSNNVTSVAFSPDNKYIISGSSDKTVKLWDKETGRKIRTFSGHSDEVNSVAFSPDNKYIISGSSDKTVKLWELKTGKEIRTFSRHSFWVISVAFSPDNKNIISGSRDKTVKLWDKETGREIRTFSGHSDGVVSVAFSHDNKHIISGSADGTIKLWDTNTGKLLITMIGFNNGEWVAYTPENYYIASPKGDKYVSFRVGNKIYDFEQYASIYKRPEIIAKILRGEEIKEAVAEIEKETSVDISTVRIQDIPPPEVVIKFLQMGDRMLPPENQTVEFSKLIITATAIERRHGIERIIVNLNGKLVYEKKNIRQKEFQINAPVMLASSNNNLSVIAYSTKMVKSYERNIQLTYREELLKGKSLPEVVRYFFGGAKSWAVVIGINDYSKAKGFDPLPYAVNDAEAVRNYLINHLGFRNDRVYTLYNNKATKKEIVKLLGDILPGEIDEDERGIIFFSGHGETRKMRNKKSMGYLIPVNGSRDALHSTAIPMTQIKDFSDLIPAKQILFIIDACYSGIAGKIHKKGELPKETRNQIEKFIKGDGRQIMTAGAADETAEMSSKWNNHSVFTYYLLKGLKGEADYTKDKVITISELKVYLDDKVPKEAKQTPQLYYLGSGEGQFVFYHD